MDQSLSMMDLVAMPELDSYTYGMNSGYVCSSLAIGIHKAAGVFKGLEINAKEFGPRDVYMVDVFEKELARPTDCQRADPSLPYCQLLGKQRMYLPGFSSIKPYDRMNERCPAIPPLYMRPDDC